MTHTKFVLAMMFDYQFNYLVDVNAMITFSYRIFILKNDLIIL